MAFKPEDEKKRFLELEDTETRSGGQDDQEDSGSGSGGQSGQIEFRDFTASTQHTRDDLLPADEKKRLLSVHKDTHEQRVKKQKDLRELRTELREGKLNQQRYREGLAKAGLGGGSQYKANPVLANAAQFSGIDKQENPLPTHNEANTNDGDRKELADRFELRYAPKNAPVFNPRPIQR